jgi:succinoglycan biosynthesis transport protein ExoP
LSDTSRILDLRDYWQLVRARMWTVVAMAVVVAAIAGAYVALRPPVYFAQAKVIVDPLVNPAISGISGNSSAFEPDMTVEAEIVRSVDIARSVSEDLGLATPPEQLVKSVRVEPVRDGAVMYIGYSSSSSETAATIANAFAQQYLDARKAQVETEVEAAIAPLDELVADLEADWGAVQASLESTDDPTERGTLEARKRRIESDIEEYSAAIVQIRSNAGSTRGGQIVQFAVAPPTPSGPGLVIAAIFGAVVGAILGAGLAIMLGLRANRVGGRDELAGYIDAPVMGVIPSVEDWSSRERAELVSREQPEAPAAEAYRTLATNVRFLRSQRPVGVIVVTSALPGEGKSATTANLAVVLAETGLPTLLVDADLRRPRAERFLGVPQGVGLREALDGAATLDDVVMATDVPNLSIVRSGQVPTDPVSLLAGPHAASVFHDMRRLADVVICDAPPTLPVADASILAEAADVVLFVHDPAISNRPALEDAVRQLRTAGAEIAGGVYNNITSLQRTGLGYASYDQYYGPDDRAKGAAKSRSSRKPSAGAEGQPTPPQKTSQGTEPNIQNGKSRPETQPTGVPQASAER